MKKYAGLLCLLLLPDFCSRAVPARAQSPESATGDWSSLSVGGTFSATRLQYGQHWLEGGGVFVDGNFNWRFGDGRRSKLGGPAPAVEHPRDDLSGGTAVPDECPRQ